MDIPRAADRSSHAVRRASVPALLLASASLATCALASASNARPRSRLPQRPVAAAERRIASLSLTADEILAELVGPPRLAAVTWTVDDPAFSMLAGRIAPSIPRIDEDPERVVATHPDLVVAAAFTGADTVEALRNSGLSVLRLRAHRDFAAIAADVGALGEVTGRETKARAMVSSMFARLAAVRRRVRGLPRPRVLLIGPSGSSSGRRTLVDEAIHLAGGVNVVAEAGLSGPVQLPLETILGLQPQVLVIAGDDWQAARARLARTPAAATLPAVRQGRVYVVPSALVACQSHRAVGLVEALASLLHPERRVP